MNVYEVVVIGSGPAGWTAGIYGVRADLGVLVIEGDQPGGQLTITTKMDNYPGFPDGVSGPELMEKMKKQAMNLGVEVKRGMVKGIEVEVRPALTGVRVNDEQSSSSLTSLTSFLVKLGSKEKIEARSVIVATGARARWLEIPGEKELMGKGVSGCATCDGMFFKDKEVAVIGGGDSAVEEALFLVKFAKKVYVVHRRDKLRASKAEQKRLFGSSKIEMVWNSEVKEFLGKESLEGLRLIGKEGEKVLKVEGVFVAIGRDPATGFLKGVIELMESGHVKTGFLETETMTSVEGIFAAGDCVDKTFRQAVVAAGMGCKAGMEVEKWLANRSE